MNAFFDRVFRRFCRRGRGLALTACLLVPALPVPVEAGTSYTLGVVPQFEQRKLFAIWKPVVDELSRRAGLEIRLVVTLTVPEFESALEKGSFDFVYANPYHILRVSDSQGYIPLVRDREPLRGILVVRRDSPVKSVEELAGKTLAVPSPNALGASLLLRADLDHLYGVHMSMVNARTHSSVYLNVLNGLTDAGGGVQKTLAEQDAGIRDGLRILYTTRAMPSHPVAAHPRIKPDVRERVRKAVLEMSATPAGRALLDEIPMLSPVNAFLEDYLVMRKWGLDTYWVDDGK
ncbi:MAG: phosphate/phosphite/phosphonate ABC transporter substrate-binding protein [Gallionella sp.]|nr:phosphate/phosphite/phosphonate ABC transporter substrate-binding protein [Gallionella sp.]